MERFENHWQIFSLKSQLLNFFESVTLNFEKLHNLLRLNESEYYVDEEIDLKNASSIAAHNVNTSSIDIKLNAKDNATKVFGNRLQGNFVDNNVLNFCRRNLTDSEKSLLWKGLNFLLTSSTIDKANVKTELERFGRLLW